MQKLKINYHLTQACNFSCKFCFAKYEQKHIGFDEQKKIIENIASSGIFDAINFAGGEPFLVKRLPELIKFADSLGLKVSVITNGYLLTDKILDEILPHLEMLGVSCHSFNDDTKREIGSCTKTGKTLSNERLAEICLKVHKMNVSGAAKCRFKINSVICKPNVNENLKDSVSKLKYVQRWKGLRCQEFGNNQGMLVTNSEFMRFKKINSDGNLNQVFENDMKDSYIMINPAGKLIKESSDGLGYTAVGSALEESMTDLMKKYNLKLDVYKERYVA